MTDVEILTQLGGIFRQIFDEDGIVLTMDTTASDIKEWDSFNHINLTVAVEEHFGIKFKTAEIESLRNVGDFVRLIQTKLQRVANTT